MSDRELQQVGLDLKAFGIDLPKIKGEIRQEINAGVWKAFLAGMACVIVGNWLYNNFVK